MLGTISKSWTHTERVLQYEVHFQESIYEGRLLCTGQWYHKDAEGPKSMDSYRKGPVACHGILRSLSPASFSMKQFMQLHLAVQQLHI